jgi:predicted ATPase/DNA-binding SARP family transcriptional activator
MVEDRAVHSAESESTAAPHVGSGAKVYLLGPLEISGPGGVLQLPGARQRALLALLALRGPEVLSRAQLVDALWGTQPPPTAVKTLHSHIARVRQALASIGLGELLVTREPGYALALETGWVDTAAFQEQVQASRQALRSGDPAAAAARLRAGLALWRGDPLADCPVEDWGRAEIARLNDAGAAAAEVLAEAELMLGEHAAVAGDLERLVVRHPLRERFWELLVIAHYRCGRQGEALQAYRRARAALVDELGIEPGPRLRQLEAAVLAGAVELDPPTAPAPDRTSRVRQPLAEQRPRTDLPVALTNLVGRRRELSEVLKLLAQARLVTLTGPGGCGKTRLAISVTDELAGQREVAMVDLTPVQAPELVVDAVATALEVPEQPGTARADTLCQALATRELLIVLDNCEHLVRSCAELVDLLLRACPGLTILATSREALRVAGEAGYEVPLLSVPNPDGPWTLSELAVYDAVRLFLDRAADNGAQAFGDADALPVAQLCAALDGLPLAIELAAARTPVLTPAQIVRRLRNRFGLLTYGARATAPRHHRALRAAVAWSHDLLAPDEAALFARLGVFVGGFSVEAAESVWEPDRALDALTGLVAKSLVRVRRLGDSSRFFMLETIAAFADEQLRTDPATETQARQRHAEFFLARAENAVLDATGAGFGELRVEHDNLRAALAWFAEADASGELRLVAALARYWRLHGHYREGRQWLDRALARAGDAVPDARAKALAGAASLALSECDYATAARYATEGIELARLLGDQLRIGRLLVLLGSVARERAEYGEALRHYREAEQSFRSSGYQVGVAYSHQFAGATAWQSGDLDAAAAELTTSLAELSELSDQSGASSSRAYLGAVALYRNELANARDLLDQSLDTFGALEFKEGIAWALNLLGLLEHIEGQHAKAAPLLQTSLALHRELGDRWRQASVLEALAAVACATGEPDRAAWLVHQAEEIRSAIGAPVPLIERPALAATHAAIAHSDEPA